MRVSILVAQAKNRVIGRDGDLPWRLSNDLRNFKKLTMGHPIVMGRKTMDSIGRLLPGRQTIILTRDESYVFDGAAIANSWEQALELARAYEDERMQNSGQDKEDADLAEVFIVGGAEIYSLALPGSDRLYLTEVDAIVDGDTLFPEIDRKAWSVVDEKAFPADEKNDHAHTFLTLDRK